MQRKKIKNYNYWIYQDGKVQRIENERFVKPHYNDDGYLRVRISNNNIAKNFCIHRLIATYFIDNPKDKPMINHKNGIKTDNRIQNLEWVNNRENIRHAFKNGHVIRKLTPKQGRIIKHALTHGAQASLLKPIFGVSDAAISRIKHGHNCYASI